MMDAIIIIIIVIVMVIGIITDKDEPSDVDD